jgi:hypothetical protein
VVIAIVITVVVGTLVALCLVLRQRWESAGPWCSRRQAGVGYTPRLGAARRRVSGDPRNHRPHVSQPKGIADLER